MQEQLEKELSFTERLNIFWKKAVKIYRKPTVNYIFHRITDAFITLMLIITAVFLLLRLIPKSRYINWDVYNGLSLRAKANYKESQYQKYGLDQPILKQLLDYYHKVLPIPQEVCVDDEFDPDQNYELVCVKKETKWIDLGTSIMWKYNQSITEIVGERFPLSFKFSIVSLVIAYMISYPLGVYMARSHGKMGDKIGNAYVILNIAVPALVFYYLWNIFGMKVLNFPSIFDANNLRSWIMPLWALSFTGTGRFAMLIRRYMVDERNSDYVKFARSKGLSEKRIMYVHVLRNAIVPLVRGIPLALMFTIQGSYFVEMLWTIPGSGFLLITALTKGDNPLVLGLVIIYAVLSMVALLLGDIITVFMDPRISLTKNK